MFLIFSSRPYDRSPRKLAHAEPERDGKAGDGGSASTAAPRGGPRERTPGRILGRGAERPSGRYRWLPNPAEAALRDARPCIARLLPQVRAHRRDPEGRRGPAVRCGRDLEDLRAAAPGRHMPDPDWPPRRRRLL